MQAIAKTAALINRVDLVASIHLSFDPFQEPRHREALRRFGHLMIGLDGDRDLLQIRVQAQLEDDFDLRIARWVILC